MAIYRNKFTRIYTPTEPRFELTKVGRNYELYHEPSGSIDTFTRLQILKLGFTLSQLKMVEENTIYFRIKRIAITRKRKVVRKSRR
jgi:hypothetical protein